MAKQSRSVIRGWLSCLGVAFLAVAVTNCSSSGTTRTIDANTSNLASVTTYAFNTTSRTCEQLTRDASSCQSTREALGLSGDWLDFSCNVVETPVNSSLSSVSSVSSATYIELASVDLPDYKSNYYATSGTYSFTAYDYTVTGLFDDLYSAYTTAFPDPGTIGAQSVTMYIPVTPSHDGTQTMSLGAVGMAVNGVLIYDNLANDTDNIFAEDGSFDQCGGHPAGSAYHYHGEPYSISYEDNKLIGVMRDGYFIYGREDNDGSTPGSQTSMVNGTYTSANTLYYYGGHTGTDPLTGTGSTFHYHLTEWDGCYDENSSHQKGKYDGETNDTRNASPTCTDGADGQWVDAWFMTGHGNGGVYDSAGSGSTGPGYNVTGWPNQNPSQSLNGVRYYYGVPGSCTGCGG